MLSKLTPRDRGVILYAKKPIFIYIDNITCPKEGLGVIYA